MALSGISPGKEMPVIWQNKCITLKLKLKEVSNNWTLTKCKQMHELWETQGSLSFGREAVPSDIRRNHGESSPVLSIPMFLTTACHVHFLEFERPLDASQRLVDSSPLSMWIHLWDFCMTSWTFKTHREERISGEKTSQGKGLRCVCGAAVPIWRPEIYPFYACTLHHR